MTITTDMMRELQRRLERDKHQLVQLDRDTRWAYGPDPTLTEGREEPPPRPIKADHGYLLVHAYKARTRHRGTWYVSDINNRQAWHRIVTSQTDGTPYWYRSLHAYAAAQGLT